jgi:hypothetical protein
MSRVRNSKKATSNKTPQRRARKVSGLSEHRQVKKELRPPLAMLPTKPTSIQWTLDDLPEMLLIEAAPGRPSPSQ